MVFYLVLERCNKCLIKVGNTCTGRNRNLNVHTCTSYMTYVGVFGLIGLVTCHFGLSIGVFFCVICKWIISFAMLA